MRPDGLSWSAVSFAFGDPIPIDRDDGKTHVETFPVRSRGWANRTPWQDATREVPQVWLEEEAKNSPCPHSLLATWKGARGGVPSYVMIKLLRRRLAESCPEGMKTPLPPIRLQRAQDTLRQIWTLTGGGGERHPVWNLVEAVLRMASDHARAHQVKPHECVKLGPNCDQR